MYKLCTILVLTACTDKVYLYPIPPPVKEGKCIANNYIGDVPEDELCVYKGYNWDCHHNFGAQVTLCKRSGQATLELH